MAKKTRRSSSRRSIEGRAKPQISVIAYLCWRVLLIAIVASALWLVYLDFTVREKFDGKKWAIPARVYAQPPRPYYGLTMSACEFVREMLALA